MNKFIVALATGAVLAAIAISACSKADPFGEGVIDNTDDFVFVDTLSIRYTLEEEDSVITADPSSTADYFLCGEMRDPVFGYSKAEIYTLYQLSSLGVSFNDFTLDSVVMYLAIDKQGIYGDTTMVHNIEIVRLQDTMDRAKLYSSEAKINVSADIIGTAQFRPSFIKSYALIDSSFNSQTGQDSAYGAYIRIPLSQSFGDSIMRLDSLSRSDDETFWRTMKGLQIRTNTPEAPSMLGFDLNNRSLSRITLFYNKGDTIHRTFHLYFRGNNKFVHFTHDYSGSEVEPLIGHELTDQLYIQGMSGLRMKIDVPYAHHLGNIAVNKAEVVGVAAPNSTTFGYSDQLVVNEYLADTAYTLISDVLFSLGPSLANGFANFGGQPKSETVGGELLTRYHMALSQHFQDMAEGIKKEPFYLAAYPQVLDPSRLVMYGPANAQYAPKIAIKYTRLP